VVSVSADRDADARDFLHAPSHPMRRAVLVVTAGAAVLSKGPKPGVAGLDDLGNQPPRRRRGGADARRPESAGNRAAARYAAAQSVYAQLGDQDRRPRAPGRRPGGEEFTAAERMHRQAVAVYQATWRRRRSTTSRRVAALRSDHSAHLTAR